MPSAAEAFDAIAENLAAAHDGVTRNAKGNLVLSGSVRAMTSTGHVVVKLPEAQVVELVASGAGSHYKDQVNQWLALDDELSPGRVRKLIGESISW